jgi:AraC-like DNA-binding protein
MPLLLCTCNPTRQTALAFNGQKIILLCGRNQVIKVQQVCSETKMSSNLRQDQRLCGDYTTFIKERLPVRYPTIDDMAHRLGIPVRTLQRRLRESGLSYSGLVEQTRHELACRLLDKPDAKAATVARALGYSDPSSFSRAFRRWTGISPRAYRNRD